ncbi:MAG: LuxR C-terminal-related transcriptional regulator [Terriglobales bacterium]
MLVSIPVFLLAENRLLREALARILDKKNDIAVVGSSTHSPSVPDAIAALQARVLLVDPIDGSTGLAFVRTIRESLPELKIVMIGMELDPELFLRAVREGIAGYLLKDATAADVAAAVRSVVNNRAVCPPELCQRLFQYVAQQRVSFPSFFIKQQFGLTRREQQLVEMIGRGFTNKEIASTLGLSEQTIKNHIHRVLRKVGVRDRLAAVEMCRTQGLLSA